MASHPSGEWFILNVEIVCPICTLINSITIYMGQHWTIPYPALPLPCITEINLVNQDCSLSIASISFLWWGALTCTQYVRCVLTGDQHNSSKSNPNAAIKQSCKRPYMVCLANCLLYRQPLCYRGLYSKETVRAATFHNEKPRHASRNIYYFST